MINDVLELANRELGESLTVTDRLRQGRNNLVVGVKTSKNIEYVLKIYSTHPSDKRQRLLTEFNAFSKLRSHGFENIPQPILSNSDGQFALYERIVPSDSAQDRTVFVRQAAKFLAELKQFSRETGDEFTPASEACFSMREIILQIERRRSDLTSIDNEMLQTYLNNNFDPLFKTVKNWLAGHFSEREMDQTLSVEDRTLSPSDFGLHNAVFRGGNWHFLDFEYFGWDDPAKMVSDFLLHPGMELSHDEGELFLQEMTLLYPRFDQVLERVKSVLPLFALKWSLILLNEFCPVTQSRRVFSGHDDGWDEEELRNRQLVKSSKMLDAALRHLYNQTDGTHIS